MTPDVKPLVAGNWKMNGTQDSLHEIMSINADDMENYGEKIDMLLCVPATLVQLSAHLSLSGKLEIGGQDCHTEEAGAHTGDISAEMLADAGATHVIVGHSERRTNHREKNDMVLAKAQAGNRAGLVTIICIGETKWEHKAGDTLKVLSEQLEGSVPAEATADKTIIAYEPVWAIGTGLVPSAEDVATAHEHIRKTLTDRFGSEGKKMRILYGGSVKPDNATELMGVANVDGALVGGASLKAVDFLGICSAYKTL